MPSREPQQVRRGWLDVLPLPGTVIVRAMNVIGARIADQYQLDPDEADAMADQLRAAAAEARRSRHEVAGA